MSLYQNSLIVVFPSSSISVISNVLRFGNVLTPDSDISAFSFSTTEHLCLYIFHLYTVKNR